MSDSNRRQWLRLAGAGAMLAACSRSPQVQIQVGAKAGQAMPLLAETLGLFLESEYGDGAITLRPPLGGTSITHETLLAGQIDLYTEYSGTALTTILGLPPVSEADSVLEQVKVNYRTRFRCEWAASLGFANPPIVVTTRERAADPAMATLSDAAASKSAWRLGVNRDFMGKRDGLPLMMGVYKLPLSGAVQVLEAGDLYRALEIGQVTLAVGEALDPGSRSPDFVTIEDDRRAFPPQDAGVVVSLDLLDRQPGLLRSLNRLEGKFPFDLVFRRSAEYSSKLAAAEADDTMPPPRLRDFAAALLRETGLNPAQ
jgi:osmoprotectant transport system substrate-binding protein